MNLEMTEKRLLKILIHGTDKELAEIIEDIHPADILDAIHENENYYIIIQIITQQPSSSR